MKEVIIYTDSTSDAVREQVRFMCTHITHLSVLRLVDGSTVIRWIGNKFSGADVLDAVSRLPVLVS